MAIGEYLRQTLPYFNMILTMVVIFFLYRILRTKNKKTYTTPWKFLLIGIVAYTVEEILTIIELTGPVQMPDILFPIIEMLIICLFIYMVLMQKRYTDMQQ